MSQTYNYNIKRSKLQDIQLGILKVYAFCWKIQQRALGPGESAEGVTIICLWEYTQELSGSRKGAVGA